MGNLLWNNTLHICNKVLTFLNKYVIFNKENNMNLTRISLITSVIFIFSFINISCSKDVPVYQKNLEEKKIEQIKEAEKNLQQIKEFEQKEQDLKQLEKGITHEADKNFEQTKDLEQKEKELKESEPGATQ
jgi:hypothetical protein